MLKDYLETERKAEEESREHWRPEFELFCELGDLYTRLGHAIEVSDSHTLLLADFYLVVESQLFGVVSQLLRRRLTDALALSRRAIEATAVAYRLWKEPKLVEIFFSAYPNVAKTGHKRQWKPSNKYRNEFSTSKLFGQAGKTWEHLKTSYELFSVLASHAGPGATLGHEMRDKQRYAPFLAVDDKVIRRTWYSVLTAYMEMWKVFLHILREKCAASTVDMLEKDFVAWRDRSGVIMSHRVPWMSKKEAGEMGLILPP